MKKYTEYHPTEVGLSKTTWNWFPCQLEEGGSIFYTNGHVVMTKPPVKNFPTECPKDNALHYGERRYAFKKPYNAGCMFENFYREKKRSLTVAGMTERQDDTSGVVTMKNSDKTETIGRHYYALIHKVYGKDTPLVFSQDEYGEVVQVRRNGKTVALVMPIRI